MKLALKYMNTRKVPWGREDAASGGKEPIWEAGTELATTEQAEDSDPLMIRVYYFCDCRGPGVPSEEKRDLQFTFSLWYGKKKKWDMEI